MANEQKQKLLEAQLESQTNPTVHTISDSRPPFNPPHWTGDSAEGLVTVPLPESNMLSSYAALRLVTELGYDAHAAFTSTPRPIWMNAKPDRRRFGVVETEYGEWLDRTTIALPIPYVSAPSRRSETGGGFTRDSVLRAVARMRASHNMRMAVFEVVFRRRFPSQIAQKFGVGVRALNKAATRVRKTIRGDDEKANKNAASEPLVGIPCT